MAVADLIIITKSGNKHLVTNHIDGTQRVCSSAKQASGVKLAQVNKFSKIYPSDPVEENKEETTSADVAETTEVTEESTDPKND